MTRHNHIPIPQAETVQDESEPRIERYKGGETALVFDQEGDQVTIGGTDKHFQDPQYSGGKLEFTVRLEDDTLVKSYVMPDKVFLMMIPPGSFQRPNKLLSRTGEGANAVTVGNVIHNKTFTIGEEISEIPGYSRKGMVLDKMVLVSVAAEYKLDMPYGGPDADAKESPFELVEAVLARHRRRSHQMGAAALNKVGS